MEHTETKKNSEKIKILIAVASSIIIIIAVIAVLTQIIGIDNPENNSIVVYRTDGIIKVRIDDKEIDVNETTASEFKCDIDNSRVYYTVESSKNDGLYDLYFIGKQRGELFEPKIIDVGIKNDFSIVSGKIFYSKINAHAAAYDGCVCDVDNGVIEVFSSNVESIFALDGADKVYFTKMHGSNKVLYSYSESGAEEVCRDIVNIFRYNEAGKPHIIYERKSQINPGMTELFVAYSDSEPEMICDNTYSVMFDEYTAGGNLYYYTSSDQSISWSAVISDDFAQSDEKLKKPVKNSFFAFLGLSAEYNEAMKKYEDKLIRDEIRAALNESADKGEFSAPVFTAFAYNQEGTFKLAEKIDPENVYGVSDFGDPRIIYESTEVIANKSDMATLVSIAEKGSISDVIDYARSLMKESSESKGIAFAGWTEKSGCVTHPLEGYNKNTLFAFSETGSRIYAFVRDSEGELLSLYTNTINENMVPSSLVNVDNGLSGYRVINDEVVYMKADTGENTGDLFLFNGIDSVKLSDCANAFTVEGSENIIVIKEHDLSSENPTGDYYICNDNGEEMIDSAVIVSSFCSTDNNKFAFISDSEKDKELKIYYNGRISSVDKNVDEIIMFK